MNSRQLIQPFRLTLESSLSKAFTLVELMVSMTVLVILMLVVSNFVALVQRTWVRTNSHVSQFREARIAFDILTRNITQATLNTYYQNEFEDVGTSLTQQITRATSYVRQSELQFVCGPTVGGSTALFTTGSAANYPGHGVFFQAPLGVTSLVATTESDTTANTENMVNLLCARGYFVAWGDDQYFRPPFLTDKPSVPLRFRLRLMEYSPTAEQNRIYSSDMQPIIDNSKQWFDNALTSTVTSAGETAATRAFTRPVAENILALIISPQLESTGTSVDPTSLAPGYAYDSTLISNGGPTSGGAQGTRHLLPPILKVTMIALDNLAGERLSDPLNSALLTEVVSQINGSFTSATSFKTELGGSSGTPGTIDKLLRQKRLNYRVFTTTISMKQSRWSL